MISNKAYSHTKTPKFSDNSPTSGNAFGDLVKNQSDQSKESNISPVRKLKGQGVLDKIGIGEVIEEVSNDSKADKEESKSDNNKNPYDAQNLPDNESLDIESLREKVMHKKAANIKTTLTFGQNESREDLDATDMALAK